MKISKYLPFVLLVVVTILTACGEPVVVPIPAPQQQIEESVGAAQTAIVSAQATALAQATATSQPPSKVVGIMETDQHYRDAMTGFFKIDAPSLKIVGAPDCGGLTLLVDMEVDTGSQAFAFVVHNDIMGNGVTCLEQVLITKYPQATYVVYGYAQLDPARRADLEKLGTKFFSKDFASSDIPAYIADLLAGK